MNPWECMAISASVLAMAWVMTSMTHVTKAIFANPNRIPKPKYPECEQSLFQISEIRPLEGRLPGIPDDADWVCKNHKSHIYFADRTMTPDAKPEPIGEA